MSIKMCIGSDSEADFGRSIRIRMSVAWSCSGEYWYRGIVNKWSMSIGTYSVGWNILVGRSCEGILERWLFRVRLAGIHAASSCATASLELTTAQRVPLKQTCRIRLSRERQWGKEPYFGGKARRRAMQPPPTWNLFADLVQWPGPRNTIS